MGYFSNLHLEMQEDNAHIQDQEPDVKEYMKTEQYAKEFDDAFGDPMQQINDLIYNDGDKNESKRT